MADFKTPIAKRTRSKLPDNPELHTPIKIPPSPYMDKLGYGCGVNVFTFNRSPKVGFTRSPWAIKKRNKNLIKDSKYNARIQFEAEILRKLNHPNIVGFRALTYSSDGEPCLAMEKLDISLGDLIEERVESGELQFPANEIMKVGFEIVKGLEYLHHTAYILHGDIKSYNILTSRDFQRVKVCDFGVSAPLTKTLEMDTSKGEFMYIGTQCWSAPEVINENGPVTNKADIWAYGLVLWEMMALSPPHVEDEDESMSSSMEDSMLECTPLSKNNDTDKSSIDDSFLQSLKDPDSSNYGTRPPLPATELGKEYNRVLEIFYVCTDEDYKTRPNAAGIVRYFKNYTEQGLP